MCVGARGGVTGVNEKFENRPTFDKLATKIGVVIFLTHDVVFYKHWVLGFSSLW